MENIKSHNDLKRNRVLFDFESIVDLKLSYLDEYYIKKGKAILLRTTMDDFKFSRMYVYEDPLKMYTYNDTGDIKHEYLIHPNYPVFTGMKKLVEEYKNNSNGLIDPVVLCKDQFQERIIKESLPKVKILLGDRSKVKTLNFSRIVLADPKQALEFRDPVMVEFMILNFRENFHKDDPTFIDERILISVGDINTFSIAKAYPEIPDPVG